MPKDNIPEIRVRGFSDEWARRKLGDMGSTFTGLSGKTKEDFGHGDAKFITYMNVFSNPIADLQMTETVEIDSKQNCVKAGDVFFTTSSETPEEVGMSCVMPENADNTYLNSFCFGYRPIEKFDLNYLAYVLRSDSFRKEMMFLAQGISRYNISKNKVMEVEIPVPSLEEQSKVGRCFSNLESLISQHQHKYESLVAVKKAMLEKMFPKEGKTIPEIRFAGFTDPWEQRKLDDVVEFLDTMRKPLEGAKRIHGPYPYYGASGIVDYVDGYLFDEELVLLSEDGANITDRNYPVCFLASGKYWVNNHAHVLRTKDGNENNFICNSLERKDYKQYNSGMAMPKLNQEVCRSIPISCPSFDEQKKIGDYFRKLDNLITLHQRRCKVLKNLKSALLNKMFVDTTE